MPWPRPPPRGQRSRAAQRQCHHSASAKYAVPFYMQFRFESSRHVPPGSMPHVPVGPLIRLITRLRPLAYRPNLEKHAKSACGPRPQYVHAISRCGHGRMHGLFLFYSCHASIMLIYFTTNRVLGVVIRQEDGRIPEHSIHSNIASPLGCQASRHK